MNFLDECQELFWSFGDRALRIYGQKKYTKDDLFEDIEWMCSCDEETRIMGIPCREEYTGPSIFDVFIRCNHGSIDQQEEEYIKTLLKNLQEVLSLCNNHRCGLLVYSDSFGLHTEILTKKDGQPRVFSGTAESTSLSSVVSSKLLSAAENNIFSLEDLSKTSVDVQDFIVQEVGSRSSKSVLMTELNKKYLMAQINEQFVASPSKKSKL